jgi:hypothetical protein
VKYFIDTEFDDHDGWPELISIAIVSDDGREYYAESAVFDRTSASPWVADHVVPRLRPPNQTKPLATIRDEATAFFEPGAREVWGMIPGYDWMLFHRLFGGWKHVPKHIPWYCWDLRQWQYDLGDPPIPEPDPQDVHHALADARWARAVHHSLTEFARRRAP